jgi:undecaprenyl-diphosphatase
MFGAIFFKMRHIAGIDFYILVPGVLAAFVSGLIALRALLSLIKSGVFYYFGYYCLIIGTATLVYFLVRS